MRCMDFPEKCDGRDTFNINVAIDMIMNRYRARNDKRIFVGNM